MLDYTGKWLQGTHTLAYLASLSQMKEKKLYNIDTWSNRGAVNLSMVQSGVKQEFTTQKRNRFQPSFMSHQRTSLVDEHDLAYLPTRV
jgi:hypothetical protein